MGKIASIEELRKLRAELLKKQQDPAFQHQVKIKVAMATCGIASGSREVMNYFQQELEKRNIEADVTSTGCMGFCYAEPTIEITKPGESPVIFGFVDLKKADEIIEKYIKKGELTDGVIPINYELA